MRFFFNAELLDHGLHGGLYSASFQRGIDEMGVLQAPFSVWEKEMRMPVH